MNCQICNSEEAKARGDYYLCDNCHFKAEAYQSKVERRLERLRASAEKTRKEASATIAHAREMASVIPFGQPILIGHHSEKRDRRYRARIENTYRRGFESLQRAKDKDQRADAAAKNDAISSDDPAAVLKLKEKLAKLEARQELMKAINKIVRKYKTPTEAALKAMELLGIPEAKAKGFFTPDFAGRLGVPSFELSNNNANMRRIRKRIAELERRQQVVATLETDAPAMVLEEEHGDITLVRDVDDNRIRLIFPGKPSKETIALLKQHGFRWSPSNRAWQRHLNGFGESAAKIVLAKLKS